MTTFKQFIRKLFQQDRPVVTRFAPSPTGFFHIGSARTALYNFLYAKKHNGTFLLRIEDTDKQRSREEYERDILEGLAWINVKYDAFFRQSERTTIYKFYLEKLLEDGLAYEAEDNNEGTGKVIRFKNTNQDVTFTDLIRGDITFNTKELGDFVLAKDKNSPLYHLSVVVDDLEEEVTHVIRGEDHISNTPRQILIAKAIGAVPPIYAHIPLILAPDKSKLSKRHGAPSLNDLKHQGYLPEAVINFLVFIGWNPGGEQEVYSPDELVKHFDLEKVQKGGGVFNKEKLDWFNKEYLKKLDRNHVEDKVAELLEEKRGEIVEKITPLIMERISKWGDVKKEEWYYFFERPEYPVQNLVWKDSSPDITTQHLNQLVKLLDNAQFNDPEKIKSAVWDYAEEKGRGEVLWPFRYALSGRDKSPDPFILASILGKEETLARLKEAKEKLAK